MYAINRELSITTPVNRTIGALKYLANRHPDLAANLAGLIDELETAAAAVVVALRDVGTAALPQDEPTPLSVLAADMAAMPPIAGGAPYEPSEADEACLEYEAWLDALEAGRDWDHEADAIHRDLYGF